MVRFFNRISSEFIPLELVNIPQIHGRVLPNMLPFQLAGRIRAFKNMKSMVKGDIFPFLMHKYAALLAILLSLME